MFVYPRLVMLTKIKNFTRKKMGNVCLSACLFGDCLFDIIFFFITIFDSLFFFSFDYTT